MATRSKPRTWLASVLLALVAMVAWPPASSSAQTGREGLFVYGSCDAPEGFVLNIGEMQLYADADVTEFAEVVLGEVDAGSGWQRASVWSSRYFVRVAPTGELQWAYLKEVPISEIESLSAPDVPEEIDRNVWTLDTLERCERLNGPMRLVHGEAVAILTGVGAVVGSCETDLDRCVNGLFEVFDIHRDERLSHAELSRLVRFLTYLGTASREGSKTEEVAGVSLGALPVGPIVATTLVHSFDYDQDGFLTLSEIGRDRLTVGSTPNGLAGLDGLDLDGMLDRFSESAQSLPALLRMLSP